MDTQVRPVTPVPSNLFAVHKLNESGITKALQMAEAFATLEERIAELVTPNTHGREMAVVRTKLQEACFFAKRAMAEQQQNQLPTP